jgi:hypothetical protein
MKDSRGGQDGGAGGSGSHDERIFFWSVLQGPRTPRQLLVYKVKQQRLLFLDTLSSHDICVYIRHFISPPMIFVCASGIVCVSGIQGLIQ